MSSIPDMDLDLENLFQPAWAQEKPAENRYEKFAGEPAGRDDRKREGRRGGPRGDSFGERRGPRPPRSGPKFGDRKKGFDRRDDRRERERAEPPAPLPEIAVVFLPDEKGVESLARQIKMTGRAYPLFQIAQLVLQKPERYAVRLAVKKKPDGAVAQPLFVCALDDTPWLSEDEAVAHVLKNHFATFYQAERTATEPPKGTYTFVAQCGMSGVILGPPNHHDYQNQLRKLHAERFARMPFDAFKARVKIVKDEAVVKKWVEEQSFKTEYVVLNVPEPLKLPDLRRSGKTFPRRSQGNDHQAGRDASGCRRAEPQFAQPRIAAAGAHGMGAATIFPAATGHRTQPAIGARTACNFSRSTRPSPTSPSRARNFLTSKPRRFRKTSNASSATSMPIRSAPGGS